MTQHERHAGVRARNCSLLTERNRELLPELSPEELKEDPQLLRIGHCSTGESCLLSRVGSAALNCA